MSQYSSNPSSFDRRKTIPAANCLTSPSRCRDTHSSSHTPSTVRVRSSRGGPPVCIRSRSTIGAVASAWRRPVEREHRRGRTTDGKMSDGVGQLVLCRCHRRRATLLMAVERVSRRRRPLPGDERRRRMGKRRK